MKLCWIGIHRFTQWRTPRHNVQSRKCILCGLVEKRIVELQGNWTVEPMLGGLPILEEVEDDELL